MWGGIPAPSKVSPRRVRNSSFGSQTAMPSGGVRRVGEDALLVRPDVDGPAGPVDEDLGEHLTCAERRRGRQEGNRTAVAAGAASGLPGSAASTSCTMTRPPGGFPESRRSTRSTSSGTWRPLRNGRGVRSRTVSTAGGLGIARSGSTTCRPSVAQFGELGVRRVSLGSLLCRAALGEAMVVAANIRAAGRGRGRTTVRTGAEPERTWARPGPKGSVRAQAISWRSCRRSRRSRQARRPIPVRRTSIRSP